MEIGKKIKELDEKDKKFFVKGLWNNLYSRSWCGRNKINYVDPNMKIAKERTYEEMAKRGDLK